MLPNHIVFLWSDFGDGGNIPLHKVTYRKLRANGRNIVCQQLNFGCYMLLSFAHAVACCYMLLRVVWKVCCGKFVWSLRRSRNKRNVGSSWLKCLTGLKLSRLQVVPHFFLKDSRASETRARVKITHARKSATRENLPPRFAFSRVGWFSRALAFRPLYYPWGKIGDYL